MWSDSQVVQSYRTRGAPFPIYKAPRMPKIFQKKSSWYQARRHVSAKVRLRNHESCRGNGLQWALALMWRTLLTLYLIVPFMSSSGFSLAVALLMLTTFCISPFFGSPRHLPPGSFLPPNSRLKKTRPFRFLLLKSVVLDWFMVSSCLSRWSLTCQNLAVNARNRAKTTNQKWRFRSPGHLNARKKSPVPGPFRWLLLIEEMQSSGSCVLGNDPNTPPAPRKAGCFFWECPSKNGRNWSVTLPQKGRMQKGIGKKETESFKNKWQNGYQMVTETDKRKWPFPFCVPPFCGTASQFLRMIACIVVVIRLCFFFFLSYLLWVIVTLLLLFLKLWPCTPATEPKTPESRKNEKKTKSPTSGWPSKIRKKCKKYRNGPKTAFLAVFVLFLFFFSFPDFRKANPGWGDFVSFFCLFGILGFLGSVAGQQGHNFRQSRVLHPQRLALVSRLWVKSHSDLGAHAAPVAVWAGASQCSARCIPTGSDGLGGQAPSAQQEHGTWWHLLGGSFCTYIWSFFLLTVKLLCLQSFKALIRRTFPL